MDHIQKVLFYLFASINTLIGIVYVLVPVSELLSPRRGYETRMESLTILAGSCTVLGLIFWSYHLVIVQQKTTAGFTVVGISYLVWIAVFFLGLYFFKGSWQ
jgi:hypothetical protein